MSPRPKTYSSTSMRFSMHVILKVTKPYFFHKLPKVTNQTFTKNKYYKSPLKKKHRFLPGYYPSKMAGMVEGCEPSTHGLPKGDLTKMVMFPSKRQGHTTTGCWQPSNGTHSLEKCTRRVQNTGGNLAFGYSKKPRQLYGNMTSPLKRA